MAFQNSMMPMTRTMLGSISGRRLTPSRAFLKKARPFRTAATTAVPMTEQIVAEEMARNRLFPMEARAFGVVSSS